MPKIEPLSDLTNLSSSAVSVINENFDKVTEALENTLSRDGSTPNSMSADLDMNSRDILNAGSVQTDSLTTATAIIGGKEFTGSVEWRGPWQTSTNYKYLDLVSNTGKVYICTEEHTSGLFGTDVILSKWELFVDNVEGPAGPQGTPGLDGYGQQVFVQDTRPTDSGPWVWWETSGGVVVNCVINDGL